MILIRRQDGVIVIAVLWICALTMWFALQIGAESRLQGEEQVHVHRRSQALYLAIGGCYEALARMGEPLDLGLGRKAQESWQPNGKPHLVEYDTGHALVIIESEGRKVNVNLTPPEQLRLVFERAGMAEAEAEHLADLVADFVDADDFQRLHGGEKDYYENQGVPYPPFNGPLLSLDQMLLIPGMTPQLFYGYQSEPPEVNPYGELWDSALPSIHSLFSLLTVHGKNQLMLEEDPWDEMEEKIITWEKGGVYRILSLGRSFGGPPSVLMWLVVRYVADGEQPYEVLYRKIL
ncbi:MAG: general secretion pathway protein GspK [Syntrophobacteraceae bacterium]|jgi:general secretion pathway protein K|nr:general secretion pathway protein GspK [Syntrophobacteraceae bacterium]